MKPLCSAALHHDFQSIRNTFWFLRQTNPSPPRYLTLCERTVARWSRLLGASSARGVVTSRDTWWCVASRLDVSCPEWLNLGGCSRLTWRAWPSLRPSPLIKGTPGYENKLTLIDSHWLVKTNGVTFIFVWSLGDKFLPSQFWPFLSFSSLSVPSGMALSPEFLSCGPKLRPLYCCDMNLCCDGVGR